MAVEDSLVSLGQPPSVPDPFVSGAPLPNGYELIQEQGLENKIWTTKLDMVLGPLYGRMAVGAPDGQHIVYHRTVYDFESLGALLESAGFEDVRRYDWRQTLHRDYDDFSQAYVPHMDKENGRLISLNVEADKP